MPRTTRAAMRNAVHEDATDPADVPLPATPQREREPNRRAPLGEIVLNQVEEPPQPMIVLEVDLSKPAKKPKAVKKKGKAGRLRKDDEKKEESHTDKENMPAVVEDDCQSSASSAVEEACEDLIRRLDEKVKSYEKPRDDQPRTPSSKAARAARKQLSPSKPQTPRFDPVVHKSRDSTMADEAQKEDSFVERIETRSPAKIANAEVMEDQTATALQGASDSLVTQQEEIVCSQTSQLSQPQPQPRIEDSVEALDALEDAIEKLGESLPAIADEPQSPVISKKESLKKAPVTAGPKAKSQATATTTMSIRTKPVAAKVDKPITVGKTTALEASKKAPMKRSPVSAAGSAPKQPVVTRKVTKPINTRLATRRPSTNVTSTSSSNSATEPTKAAANISTTDSSADPGSKRQPVSRTAKRRVSSLSKAPFVPAKSSKPPTTSTFALPGEAVSAKLKAAKEERLKREEENASASNLSVASKVRTSLANAKIGPGGTVRVKPTTTRPSVLRNRVSSAAAVVPRPSLGGGNRVSSVAHSTKVAVTATPKKSTPTRPLPNSSAPRTSPKTNSTATSTNATAKSTGTGSLRGKPSSILSVRDRELKARKEKEEAARKARADAAERGRLASREWAEKMKAREEARKLKLAVTAANNKTAGAAEAAAGEAQKGAAEVSVSTTMVASA